MIHLIRIALLALLTTVATSQSQLWIQRFGRALIDDNPIDTVLDGSGGVFVSGVTSFPCGFCISRDPFVARYDSAGNQLWTRWFGTGTSEDYTGAVTDGAGGVYLSGTTWGDLGGPNAGQFDAWLVRYDGAGNQLWSRQLGTSGYDYVYSRTADGSGGLYVCGSTDGSLGGQSAGNADAWLARYDSSGTQLWICQLGTNAHDIAFFTSADGAGGVYVGGSTGGALGGPASGPNDDAWLARYDSAGNQLWIQQFGANASPDVVDTVQDGGGGIYLIGTTYGSVVGGTNAGLTDVWLAHYDGSGSQSWIRQLGSTSYDDVSAAAPDEAGGVYLGGYTYGSLGGPFAGGQNDAWFAHYDAAGHQLWIRQLGTGAGDSASIVAPDGSGGVYVGGRTSGSLAGPFAGGQVDGWLANYDGAGNELWSLQVGSANYEYATTATPTGSGGAFVSGGFNGDVWVARYDGVLASRHCSPAAANSTGSPATLSAIGSNLAQSADVTLIANQLPAQSFGFFLTSSTQGFTASPGGSQGNLCLDGSIGRYVGPGQVQTSGGSGTFELTLDLANHPQPTGAVSVQPGETWNFQAWYRDANPGPTSNFTDAVSVTFL